MFATDLDVRAGRADMSSISDMLKIVIFDPDHSEK
jgi:hypothetical protein